MDNQKPAYLAEAEAAMHAARRLAEAVSAAVNAVDLAVGQAVEDHSTGEETPPALLAIYEAANAARLAAMAPYWAAYEATQVAYEAAFDRWHEGRRAAWTIRHRDGDPENNALGNLEVVPATEE